MRQASWHAAILVGSIVAFGAAHPTDMSGAPGERHEGYLPDDPLAGGRLFIEKGCVRCHAINGEGGAGGPDLGKAKTDRGFLELAGVMWNHSPRMDEEFGRQKFSRPTFTEDEMAKIIAFVYFLNYFDNPGDRERGQALFVEKGCQRCHAVGGRGGQVGKALDSYSRYASPIFISTGMWNNGARMAETMRQLGIPRPTFMPGDVRDIMAYIRGAGDLPTGENQVFLPPGNPRHGARLFREKHCIDCHAIRGTGWSAGPNLGRAELRGSLSTIAGFQWNHGPAMWEMMQSRGLPVPEFTPAEMSDIVAYLYFIQYIEEPGDAASGQRLFSEKGCSSCHATTGEGPSDGQRVTEMEPFSTPAAVIAAMWNHASEMERLTWEKNIVWPTVRDNEMADLIAFLLASSSTAAP